MAPKLGPADSFNSSSATIRPDDNQRSTRSRTQIGGLGPSDSVGRDFSSLLGGNIGLLQREGEVGDETMLQTYLREYSRQQGDPNAGATMSPVAAMNTLPPTAGGTALGRTESEFNPLAFLNDAQGGTFFDQVLDPSIQASLAQVPPPAGTSTDGHELYRPTSAHSHRSNLSLSTTDIDTDSGFYTTDMDTDDHDYPSAGPNPVTEIGQLNLNNTSFSPMSPFSATGMSPAPATISPDADGLGRRRPSVASKRPRGVGEEPDQRRVDKLEHRRSINRRSAQKHRLRRKEELETLTRQLTERDARIAQLETELAVARAQLGQLATLVRGGLALKDKEKQSQ